MTLPTKLFHYSCYEFSKWLKGYHIESYKKYHEISDKPYGVWISVEEFEDDTTWKSWSLDCDFRKDDLNYCYKITLKPGAKILYLQTSEQIREFGIKYQGNDQENQDRFCRSIGTNPYPYVYRVRWIDVMKEYDGIIIAPYDWVCRNASDTFWYYGWDCASGCIWNHDVLEDPVLDSMQYPQEVKPEEKLESQEAGSLMDLLQAKLAQLQ